MPIRQAYKLCPQGIFLRGHFSEYIHYSKAVKKILEEYAPLIEQSSIDEYYIDFTGCEKIYGDFPKFALFLQNEIKEKLSLPCSIGIGSNKTIAKIGSDFKKPMGVTYVAPGDEKKFLSPLPVEKMPGVGKVNSKGTAKPGHLYCRRYCKTAAGLFCYGFWKIWTRSLAKSQRRGN